MILPFLQVTLNFDPEANAVYSIKRVKEERFVSMGGSVPLVDLCKRYLSFVAVSDIYGLECITGS